MKIKDKILSLLTPNKTETEEEKVSNAVETTTTAPKDPKLVNVINNVKVYKGEQDRISAIPDIVYQPKTYTVKTDEEIEKEVLDTVGVKYDTEKKEEEKKKNATVDGYNADKTKAVDSANNQKHNVTAIFDNAEKTVSNNAIKRGLQRSSIIAEQISDLANAEIGELIKVDEQLNDELNVINNKIDVAEKEYQEAVSNLDIKKAVEVRERVDALKVEQNQKIEEVNNYNQRMQKEAEDANQLLNKEKSDAILVNRRKIVNEVLGYYYTLPKETRYEAFMSNTELIELLGDDATYIAEYLK